MTNKSNRTQNAKLNTISSLLLQLTIAISGLILPRLIIPQYGSDINGIVASITQFLSYITLFEAGLGGVFKASLYKPLYQKDMEAVSGIINEQKRFYRKIGFVFALYVLIMVLSYPLLIKTEEETTFVVGLILILSIGTFIEYFVSLPYQSLLTADQMVRIVNISSIITIVLNIIVTTILVRFGTSIITIKACTCIISIIKPVVYVLYVKKHYCLDNKAKPATDALNQKWNGFVHHIAFYIHRNTDIVILSLFVGTATVSVYSIYLAVVTGIQKVITSVSTGLSASIGNMIADGNKETIEKNVRQFEFVQVLITTIFYTITALMLMPFIRIYTSNMKDANYIQPIFGYCLIVAEAIYCIRCIYSTISMNGNRFKETQIGAVLESVINLSVSLILIFCSSTIENKLIGIAVGTLLGMMVRLIYEIYYLSKDLIFRPMKLAIKTIGIYMTISIVSIVCCKNIIDYECQTIFAWIVTGLETSLIVVFFTLTISFFLYKNTMIDVIKRLIRKTGN